MGGGLFSVCASGLFHQQAVEQLPPGARNFNFSVKEAI